MAAALPPALHNPAPALHSPAPHLHARPAAMSLRFSANVSWLFAELPGLPARLEAASRCGFAAAELGWPEGCPAPALRRAAQRAGLRLVLLNAPPGTAAGTGTGGAGGGSGSWR